MQSLTRATGKPPWLIEQLVARRRQVCLLAPMFAVIYMCLVITPEFNERTRISESALLPALVTETFSYRRLISTFHKDLQSERQRIGFIERLLVNYRLAVERQQFAVKLANTNRTGENVIGVVRASRSPSVEAILVAVPVDDSNLEAVALTLALAAHCREQIYWARDIIFVFTDSNVTGMLAFLTAYHGDQRDSLESEHLRQHSGAIVGGFVLKTTGQFFDTINIQYNMANGLLPNLDLINLMVRLADKFGLNPVIFDFGYQNSWQDLAATTLQGMLNQAFKNDEGLHSVFGLYGIQAVTIHAKSVRENHASLGDLAFFSEGALRSLNNILEKFHQSYFLYILPNTRRFISVAYYMPILGLLILPLVVSALHEWFAINEFKILASYLIFHVIGIIEYSLARHIFLSSEYSNYFDMFQIILVAPIYLFFPLDQKFTNSTKFLFYLEYALIAGSLSLLNFSLAFILSSIVVPLILVTTNTTNKRLIASLKVSFGFLSHPIIIYLLYRTTQMDVKNSVLGLYKLMDDLIRAHFLYDNLIYPFTLICLLPMWNLLMQISVADYYSIA